MFIGQKFAQVRIMILEETGMSIPETLLRLVLALDSNAQVKRRWDSVIHGFSRDFSAVPDMVVDIFSDTAAVLRRINVLWELRVRRNYSPRPLYVAISRVTQPALTRYEIERYGGHFLYVADIPNHFMHEVEQLRMELCAAQRSLPRWQIVREGQGKTARVTIHLLERGTQIRLGGSDRHNAVLAAMLKRNAMPRSINEWRKILAEDPLFKPAGGSFSVPSRNTLKAYLHRDFPKYLQAAFNGRRSGYAANRVIERMRLDGKTMGYRIRGQCLPIGWH
jgi:hypothetical protein